MILSNSLRLNSPKKLIIMDAVIAASVFYCYSSIHFLAFFWPVEIIQLSKCAALQRHLCFCHSNLFML